MLTFPFFVCDALQGLLFHAAREVRLFCQPLFPKVMDTLLFFKSHICCVSFFVLLQYLTVLNNPLL